jgi:hypothetical protein
MNEFDNILNECIGRVLKGEPVEKCAADYPGYAAELKPLLETVMETRRAAVVMPRPEFRQRAGLQFQDAIREIRPARRGYFVAHQAWITTVIAVVAVLIFSTGTVLAADYSLPDSPLYAVKIATENARLALTSEEEKTELYASFADERVKEIVKMAEQGKTEELEKATARMDKQLVAMALLTAPEDGTGIVEGQPVETMFALEAPAPVAPEPSPAPAAPAPGPARAPKAGTGPFPVSEAPPEEEFGEAPPTIMEFAVANATGPAEDAALREKGVPPGKSKLKVKISQQAEKNRQELEEVLQRSPEKVKDALKKALEVAGRGYDNALKNVK